MKNVQPSSQFEVSPYPSTLQSGWMPKPGSNAWGKFHDWLGSEVEKLGGKYDELAGLAEKVTSGELVMDAEELEKQSCYFVEELGISRAVWDLYWFLTNNEVVASIMAQACRQNATMRNAQSVDPKGTKANPNPNYVPIPPMHNAAHFALSCQALLTRWPHFIDDQLVGLPFSGMTVSIDPTLAGSQLLGLPQFNEKMGAVLAEWHQYLTTFDSAGGFMQEGEQWLSDKAKAQYQFDDWKKDQEELPYWTSWDNFFTRDFKDPGKQRPVAAEHDNQVAICPNDGSLFRWDYQVPADNPYWFKDMPYSLRDILRSDVPEQQQVIEKHGLVDMFTDGYLFQTYLNPYNFHRWWVPVNGKVLFEPFTIPGAFFAKLVLPDFTGATTASLPYLCEINARGLIVFKTQDYGHVCCIPLGMSEVSTVTFDPAMQAGHDVRKGQEMGRFHYGGSSFAILYENLPDKQLVFMDADGNHMPQRPVLPSGSASTGGVTTNIGQQIGVWYSR